MIIKAKPLPGILLLWCGRLCVKLFRRRFNKMIINEIDIKPGHSYILMCNHFSFLDGFLAIYLALKGIHDRSPVSGFYIMVLKKQMQKNWWLKYIGAFSIAPGGRSMEESFNYAAGVLGKPGNLLLFFPQGNLESQHVRTIEFKEGIAEIISRVDGNCQLIWSSTLLEYYESTKPSVYYHLLDCGTNHEFNLGELKSKVNNHHRESIDGLARFTRNTN